MRRGKLSSKYIGPFDIIARVGNLPSRLQLPKSVKGIHNVFHVSVLRKYLWDPEQKVELESFMVQQDLTISPCVYFRIVRACYEEKDHQICESPMD